MGITNTHYLNIYFDGQGGYTGIQIKWACPYQKSNSLQLSDQ
jgi:hypothetical protein